MRAEATVQNNIPVKFLDLSNAARTAVIRKAHRQGGNVVLRRARTMAPVDTGNLKRSLQNRVRVRSRKATGSAHIIARQPRGAHAYLVELGTVHMAAQPFLRPALDQSRSPVEQEFEKALREEIDKRIERAGL